MYASVGTRFLHQDMVLYRYFHPIMPVDNMMDKVCQKCVVFMKIHGSWALVTLPMFVMLSYALLRD